MVNSPLFMCKSPMVVVKNSLQRFIQNVFANTIFARKSTCIIGWNLDVSSFFRFIYDVDGKLNLSQSVAPHFAPCFIGKMDTTSASIEAMETGTSLRFFEANAVQNRGAGNGNSSPPPKKIEMSFTRKKWKKNNRVWHLYFWFFLRFDDGVKSQRNIILELVWQQAGWLTVALCIPLVIWGLSMNASICILL